MVGGGYTGLWTALRARERYPDLDVLLLEGGTCGWQASGRNGGFVDASLTHGYGNGIARWPDELAELDRLGDENLTAIEETIARYGIDCRFERTGGLDVATAPHQVDELRELVERPAGGRSRRRASSRPTRSARGSTRRRTSAPSTTPTGSPWSSRPGWPGGCARPATTSASASTSTPA